MDPATSPKSYWPILKVFPNNRKVPCIPSLLHENKFIIDFKRKAEIFDINFCFINTCSYLRTTLTKKTHESLSKILSTSNGILKIVKNLDPNKAHSHNMISIWMVKLCDSSLCKPLELLFKSYLENGKFPLEWKRAIVVPANKKRYRKINNEIIFKNRTTGLKLTIFIHIKIYKIKTILFSGLHFPSSVV